MSLTDYVLYNSETCFPRVSGDEPAGDKIQVGDTRVFPA